MDFNEELKCWFKKYKEKFNDSVPLMLIEGDVSNEELIAIIKKSIDENKNLLPEYFGYDSDPNKIY